MSKRRYRQQVRAEAAEETRQRVLDALYELLRDQPAEPVSVEEIAQHARVSRSTVYLAFGSRSGLFDALTERLLLGPGNERIEEAVRHPDARETLRGGPRWRWLVHRWGWGSHSLLWACSASSR
jgi:AcrR family transcriptional regulator